MKYDVTEYENLLDFHMHSTFSGEAVSSPTEMIDAARAKGLKMIALTEHYYPFAKPQMEAVAYPADKFGYDPTMIEIYMNTAQARCSQYIKLSELLGDIQVFGGIENNVFHQILIYNKPFINTIGAHSWMTNYAIGVVPSVEAIADSIYGSVSESRRKLSFIAHPERTIMAAVGDTRFESTERAEDCKKFVRLLIDQNKDYVFEVNIASLEHDNIAKHVKAWLKVAKEANVWVIVNTDTHFKYGVGRQELGFQMLQEVGYPANRIVNFDKDKALSLLVRC